MPIFLLQHKYLSKGYTLKYLFARINKVVNEMLFNCIVIVVGFDIDVT